MHPSSDLNNIRYRNIRNNLSKCEFRENRGSESHTSLSGINEFLFILLLVQDIRKIMRTNALVSRKSAQEGRAFHMCVTEITFTRVPPKKSYT
jgi:hypothetical protein